MAVNRVFVDTNILVYANLMVSQKVQKLVIRLRTINKKLCRVPASVERFLRNRQTWRNHPSTVRPFTVSGNLKAMAVN